MAGNFTMQSTSDAALDLPPSVARPRAMLGLWLASAALGAAAAWIIYDAEPGLNWLLFALGLTTAVVVVERPSWRELRSRRYQAMALLVVLAGAAVVTGNRNDQLLLFVGTGWLAAVAACFAARRPQPLGPGWLAAAPFVAPVQVARDAAAAVGVGVRAAGTEASAPLLRGALLALLIVAVFVALLGEADPTLATVRDSVVDLIANLNGIGRVVFCVVVALAALGFLHGALRPASGLTGDSDAPGRSPRHTDLERMIVLGSVAVLFATFLLLQLSYLFGNPGAQHGSGVTLAQAVHRGFGEISVVVALTTAIIALLDRDALRGARERWAQALAFCVLAECLLLLASAYYRVSAYEQAYGYTVFRMYVRLYVGVLALATLLLARELATGLDLARFCWRAAVAGLAALAILSYWNYSAWIVRANVDRFVRTGQIDLGYLEHADVNGLPELVRSLPQLAPDARATLTVWLRERSLPARAPAAFAWFEWNLRRAEARTAQREAAHDSP
jgi:hypothetical protein